MKSSNRIRLIVASFALGLIALIALPTGAGAHGGHDHGPKQVKKKTQRVNIVFSALNGNRPVRCGTPIRGLGNTSRNAELKDLRFYVTGVQMLRRGGGAVNVKLAGNSKWRYSRGKSSVTLIDLENAAGDCAAEGTKGMNARVVGSVPKGRYVGVRYSISAPAALNHTDVTAVPAPMNLTGMAWSWQAGRKYMKIELGESGTPAWASKTYFLHVGSTDCKGNPAAGETARCGLPNRNRITLRKFNPVKQKIALDLKRLFGGVDITGGGAHMGEMGAMSSMGDMPGMGHMGGCMSATSSADCAPLFKSLGMKLGTKKKVAQNAFRVVRK